MASVRGWIEKSESAKEMLCKVLTERPLLLLPPLHRVPLRVGNVVEIVGPSPSAKTDILIQAAVSCILPKDWKGAHYGGLGRSVMFVDLDCRFDILRLSQALRRQIIAANGTRTNVRWEQNEIDVSNYNSKEEPPSVCDEELFVLCMRRFLYVRCCGSFEFLATLKTMHYQLQEERDKHGTGVHLLMIDSIGAFYWIDRVLASSALGGLKWKNPSLQNVSEMVVKEIQKLLLVHPMLVLATKAANFGAKYTTNDVKRASRKWTTENALDSTSRTNSSENVSFCEYMPSVWQTFITHRILVQASGFDAGGDRYDIAKPQNHPIFLSKWLLPSLNSSDQFIVRDAGIFLVRK